MSGIFLIPGAKKTAPDYAAAYRQAMARRDALILPALPPGAPPTEQTLFPGQPESVRSKVSDPLGPVAYRQLIQNWAGLAGPTSFVIPVDLMALQVGPMSHAFDVSVTAANYSTPIVVSARAPWIGLLKAPVTVSVVDIGWTLYGGPGHALEIIGWRIVPGFMSTQRNDLFVTDKAGVVSGSVIVRGRSRLRVAIQNGNGGAFNCSYNFSWMHPTGVITFTDTKADNIAINTTQAREFVASGGFILEGADIFFLSGAGSGNTTRIAYQARD